MRSSVLLLLLVAVAGVLASSWEMQAARANQGAMLPLRFALNQQNLGALESTLLDVSNPYSANYGKWWSTSEILDLVSPPKAVSQSVADFLHAHGAVNIVNLRDMIKCNMMVGDIESLFATTLSEYVHKSGKVIIRTTTGYTLPSAIAEHVSFVAGLDEFPLGTVSKGRPIELDEEQGNYVVPTHIQQLYGLPSAYPNNPASSIGLIEFQNDNAFSTSDLLQFTQETAIPNFNVSHIVGRFSGIDLEPTLDVQYGGAIAINGTMWFWTVDGWMYEFATDILNAAAAPLVVSMSWGWPEPNQCQIDPANCTSGGSFEYVARVNVEFMKIGMNGITLVAASGDQGAPGDGNAGCRNFTSPLSTIFPGASPWVLSVGATMLSPTGTMKPGPVPPICKKVNCSNSFTEEVCTIPQALITTGGGFSNVSPRPAFQNAAVNAYLTSGVVLPSYQFFNKSNRGFPDVSALGHNYIIVASTQNYVVDGTSCSSPVLAGMITLLNSYRINSKKAPLGYIVPLMYAAYAANPAIFNDITTGNNTCTEFCCSEYGYQATKGWDPVTGLGTPQFPLLLKYVQGLN